MLITQQTPILIVESIEAVLPFWTNVLGYTKTVDVPHEGRLGFAILVRDDHTLMLQTEASIRADLGEKSPATLRAGTTVLYIDVDDIDAAIATVKRSGATVIAGPRKTNYGANEIFCAAPGGFVMGFAQH